VVLYTPKKYLCSTLKKKNKYLVELGEHIRDARKAKGLSQEQLALQAEIDRSYIGGIERGERNVSFLTLVKIATCLECDLSKFTKGIPK
jgi:transcriptional regulator with XRE-family HTH domain